MHCYDEHIQKLLDAGNFAGEWNNSEDMKTYKALYQLLETGIPVELPANFSNKVEARLAAKRERPLQYIFATLIVCFLAAAILMFVSLYPGKNMAGLLQAVYVYRWAFVIALLVTGFVIKLIILNLNKQHWLITAS